MREISVVIPTFRRLPILRRLLDRLETQAGIPLDAFEAIVVPDARDGDSEGLRAAIGRRPFRARLLEGEKPGVSAARNRGWRGADAETVLFLGDDILPRERLLAEHAAWHRRHPEEEVAVLGHITWARELDVTLFMRWLERGLQFDYPSIRGTEATWGHFYTANVSVKRALLERAGGFDESFIWGYEDLELSRRLDRLGLRLLYNRRARAEHLHPTTVEDYGRRLALLAPAERQVVNKHPDLSPRLHRQFSRAQQAPEPSGRGAQLARIVPPWLPWLGPRVWASVNAVYRRRLAPAFLAAWEESASETGPTGAKAGR